MPGLEQKVGNTREFKSGKTKFELTLAKLQFRRKLHIRLLYPRTYCSGGSRRLKPRKGSLNHFRDAWKSITIHCAYNTITCFNGRQSIHSVTTLIWCWYEKYYYKYYKYYTWYLIVSAGRNMWDGASSAGYYWEIDEDSLVGHFIFMIITMILMIRSGLMTTVQYYGCIPTNHRRWAAAELSTQSQGVDCSCRAMKLGKFVSMHFALLNYLLSKNEITVPPSPPSPLLPLWSTSDWLKSNQL